MVQPENRGTAPAIAYALFRTMRIAPDDPVAIFPGDHHVSDDRAFMRAAEQALETVTARPALTVLLGVAADRPELEYGWIEPGDPLCDASAPVYEVRRFWEKPAREVLARATPGLVAAMAPLRARLDTSRETRAAEAVYAAMPCRRFLARRPDAVGVGPGRPGGERRGLE